MFETANFRLYYAIHIIFGHQKPKREGPFTVDNTDRRDPPPTPHDPTPLHTFFALATGKAKNSPITKFDSDASVNMLLSDATAVADPHISNSVLCVCRLIHLQFFKPKAFFHRPTKQE